MKKLLVVCLAMILVICTGTSVFAAQDDFVSSPSVNIAPSFVNFKTSNDECDGVLAITSYSDRDSLAEDKKALLENAYASIVKVDDLTKLNEGLAEIVTSEEIDSSYLAVSDLFDLSVINCENHEGHSGFGIILQADTLRNFVALLHMNNAGEWELVDNADIVDDGNCIQFSVETLSPFAIVVDTFSVDYIAGDINNTGEVNARDVVTLRRYIVGGWDIQEGDDFVLMLANVNYPKDNVINARDVDTLKRFLSDGWDVELTLPENDDIRYVGALNSTKYSGNNAADSISYESASLSATNSESNGVIYFCIVAMAASAVAIVAILVKNKKKNV